MNSQQFYSSLQRELWESRSIYIAPVAVAGLFLFGFVINTVRLPQRLGIEQPYDFVALTHIWLMLFPHLMLGHGLWYAPIYAWFLLVSAWARRAPLLWAVLPPVVVGAVEKAAFNTSHFAAIVQHRFVGGPSVGWPPTGVSMEAMTPFTLGELLGSPGLWIGFTVATAFLAAAIKLRRDRGPI